jgi:hypothetical protein
MKPRKNVRKNVRAQARFSVVFANDPMRKAPHGTVRWDAHDQATVELTGEGAEAIAEDLVLGLSGMTPKERDQARHSLGTSLGPVHVYLELR